MIPASSLHSISGRGRIFTSQNSVECGPCPDASILFLSVLAFKVKKDNEHEGTGGRCGSMERIRSCVMGNGGNACCWRVAVLAHSLEGICLLHCSGKGNGKKRRWNWREAKRPTLKHPLLLPTTTRHAGTGS